MIAFPVSKYGLLGLLCGEWVEDQPGTGVRMIWNEMVAVEIKGEIPEKGRVSVNKLDEEPA